MELSQLVEMVNEHAIQHYEDADSAWDVIVECWSGHELAVEIADAGCTTPAEAIAAIKEFADLYAEKRANERE